MITEDQLEQLCLEWFQSTGYDYVSGYDIAPDGDNPERNDYRQIILHGRLLSCLQVINPHIPTDTLALVAPMLMRIESNLKEMTILQSTRDALLPKRLSSELFVNNADIAAV